nr:reverse transcriptase zinc-binding domain-containing protein [Tanacetum cinerariifolium]
YGSGVYRVSTIGIYTMVLKYRQRTESDGWIWRIGKHKRSKDGGVGKSIDNPYARSVENVSFSFFITNFPNTLDAKTLWTWCMMHGKVMDVYIANKLSKFGKRFGFIRFMRIKDENEFARKLSQQWIGSHHLYVSIARFKPHIANNMGKHVMQKSSQEKENKGSFASVVAGEGSCHNKASMGVSSKQTNTIGMKNLVLNEND